MFKVQGITGFGVEGTAENHMEKTLRSGTETAIV